MPKLVTAGVATTWWAAAYSVHAVSYSATLLLCRLRRPRLHRGWAPTGRLAVIGAFHNPNWFLSHLTPLSRCGATEVFVVTDEAWEAPAGVRVVCPPRWLSRCLGRAAAKLAWLFACSLRVKPDVFIGYHIVPGSLSALFVARLLDRPACYQMTGGPAEIQGGGYGKTDNPVMRRLLRPSALLERLALAVVREFDVVVVRGTKARAFLAEHGITSQVHIITGSVTVHLERRPAARSYDLVYVGQMIERKQPLDFIAIAATVRQSVPALRAAMVGDGPLLERVRSRVSQLGIHDGVEVLGRRRDVDDILARSAIFVLPSRSEGVSIALIEAMAAGAVPVVADVGDLADLVTDGESGYLVTPGDIADYVARIRALLSDPDLWAGQSRAAVEAARRCSGVDVVTGRWRETLRAVVDRFAQSRDPDRCRCTEQPLRGPTSRAGATWRALRRSR